MDAVVPFGSPQASWPLAYLTFAQNCRGSWFISPQSTPLICGGKERQAHHRDCFMPGWRWSRCGILYYIFHFQLCSWLLLTLMMITEIVWGTVWAYPSDWLSSWWHAAAGTKHHPSSQFCPSIIPNWTFIHMWAFLFVCLFFCLGPLKPWLPLTQYITPLVNLITCILLHMWADPHHSHFLFLLPTADPNTFFHCSTVPQLILIYHYQYIFQ